MADYPTSSYSPRDALKAYQDILASEKRKKKYATLIDGMMKLSPRYSGSTAETHNRTLRDKYGTSDSTGFATHSRLLGEAAESELDQFFMQEFLNQEFKSIADVRSWGASMGPEMTEARLSKFMGFFTKRTGEERETTRFDIEQEKYTKGKALSKLTKEYLDSWHNRYRHQKGVTQQKQLSTIWAEISESDMPTTGKVELMESVVDSLKKIHGGFGETWSKEQDEIRKTVADEREEWKFDQLVSDKANVTASLAIARQMSEKVEELVSGGMNILQAKNQIAEEYEKTGYDRDEFNKSVKTRVGEDATLTAPSKRTEEMITFLTPTGDDANDLRQAQVALESERQSMSELNPAWHTYGAAAQSGIAVQNFLRALRIADSARLSQLGTLKAEFEKHIAQFTGADIETESIRVMEESVKKLRLPRLVIEFILFPEKFEFGQKQG
jgi:hypothetical protein